MKNHKESQECQKHINRMHLHNLNLSHSQHLSHDAINFYLTKQTKDFINIQKTCITGSCYFKIPLLLYSL